ncbi:hypothetical protein BDAP_000590, partial [Binucleata daphniae]
FNATIINKLRKCTNSGKLDWEENLQKAIKGYMYSYNQAMGTFKAEFKYGRMAIFELDKTLGYKNKNKYINKKRRIAYVTRRQKMYKNQYVTKNEHLTK